MIVAAMLLLGSTVAYAQTPGQIPMFDQPATGFCNSAGGNDCIDSTITQDPISGNIGIGTTAPDSPLSIAQGVVINQNNDANIPDFCVLCAGFRQQTIHFGDPGTGEAIFSNRVFPSSNQFGLSFMTSYNTRMVVANNGNVGIGTTSPIFKLDVSSSRARLATSSGTDGPFFNLQHQGEVGGRSWFIGTAGTANDGGLGTFSIYDGTAGVVRMVFDGSGNVAIGTTTTPAFKLDVAGAAHATSFPTSSDARLKKNVQPLSNVVEKIERLRGVTFDWNERYEALGRSTGKREIGVIAQEVEAVFPELVTTWGDESYRAVDYGRPTGVLIEGIKEQQAQIRDLRAQNSELKARLEALEGVVRNVAYQTAWSEPTE